MSWYATHPITSDGSTPVMDPDIGLFVHLEAEDVLAHTLRFRVLGAGEYIVLLMNWTESPADLAIEIPDWLAPALL